MGGSGPTPTGGDGTIAWRVLLAEATERLAKAGVAGDPAHDARRIVEQVTGSFGADVHRELDRPVTVREVARFDAMLARRSAGEPLQYVLGSWSFRTLDLHLDRLVLIPRPETEVVAEHALREVDRFRAAGAAEVRVVDLGTGSGAIALSVAVERAGVEVWATDVSADAIDVAAANLAGLGRAGRRVNLRAGDWFDALPAELAGTVHVVVSNPPYVAAHEPLPSEVLDWEPAGALVPGPTGLEAYEVIVAGAMGWLAPAGALVLEIGATQGEAVSAMARTAGLVDVAVHPDLVGRDRIVVAHRADDPPRPA